MMFHPVGRTTANGSTFHPSRETGDAQVWKMPASGGPQGTGYKARADMCRWSLPMVSISTTSRLKMRCGGCRCLAARRRRSCRTWHRGGPPMLLGKQGIYFHKGHGTGSRTGAGVFLRFATLQNFARSLPFLVRVTDGAGAFPPDEMVDFCISQRDQVSSDLMLVENFR